MLPMPRGPSWTAWTVRGNGCEQEGGELTLGPVAGRGLPMGGHPRAGEGLEWQTVRGGTCLPGHGPTALDPRAFQTPRTFCGLRVPKGH